MLKWTVLVAVYFGAAMAFFCGYSIIDDVITRPVNNVSVTRMGWALGLWCIFIGVLFSVPIPWIICQTFNEVQEED